MTKKNKVWLCIFAAFVLFGLFSTSFKPETTLPREIATPITTPYITTTPEPTPNPTEELIWEDEESEKKEDMVYISESGEKYHRRSKCGNSNKMKQILREEAIKQGYEPCGKCY